MICDEERLIGRQMFAIDGCKIKSNVSKEWSGTYKELSRKVIKLRRASQRIIERHQSQDKGYQCDIDHDVKQKEKRDKTPIK
jgi:hypothetical protein